jgi:hypothetical protein
MADRQPHEGSGGILFSFLIEAGLSGLGPLSSADALAAEYQESGEFRDDDERIDALIRRETMKNFTTGFITGLGGFVTLPVAAPTAVAVSWLLQARMAGAIARVYGYDPAAERVRTKILFAMAGDVVKDAMRDLGFRVEPALTRQVVEQIPGRALVEVNKRIGARLLARAGQPLLLRFPRALPVLGGVVSGSLDAVVCRMVGRTAQSLLRPPAGRVIEGEVEGRESGQWAVGSRQLELRVRK